MAEFEGEDREAKVVPIDDELRATRKADKLSKDQGRNRWRILVRERERWEENER